MYARIFNKNTNEPIEFASVYFQDLKIGGISDSLGNVLFQVPPGRHRIEIKSLNTLTLTRAIDITKDTLLFFFLEEYTRQLEEIVVTGTMKEMTRAQSPVPVEIITPTLFRKNPAPSLLESIGMVNGVRPQINCNVCNTGDIHINGMEGPYTVVLIDGMPIVSALSTVYGLQGIPSSLIDRLEIVKGPASSLYGSEAMGGIINVITKNPYGTPKLSMDYFGSTWNEHNLDIGLKFDIGKVKSLLGANYFNYSRPIDNNKDGFTDMTLQKRISLFNKYEFQKKQQRNSNLAWRYVYEDRWGGQIDYTSTWRGTDSIYGESIYTNRFELIGKYELPVKEHVVFQYSYNIHHQNSMYGTTSYTANQQVGFGQLFWDHPINRQHTLLLGTSLKYTVYDDNTPGTQNENGLNEIDKKPLAGAFLQDEYLIDPKSSMLIGYRYDYDKFHRSIHSPRIAYKWSPDLYHAIRFNFGTGFRVVNLFTEDHAALTGARKVEIKEDLLPERSINGTLNLVKKIYLGYNFYSFDLSIFYTYFANKITGDFDSDPSKIIYSNVSGHAISKGTSLNTDISIADRFKFFNGISYMDVYQVDHLNNRFTQLYAPKWSGTFTGSYSMKSDWSLDLSGQWNGPMRLPVFKNDFRPEYSPWFIILNIQATKKIKNEFEVYGNIKNVFNFIPKYSLMRPFDPFDKKVNDPLNNPYNYSFDTAYNYASLQGIRGVVGFRYKIL